MGTPAMSTLYVAIFPSHSTNINQSVTDWGNLCSEICQIDFLSFIHHNYPASRVLCLPKCTQNPNTRGALPPNILFSDSDNSQNRNTLILGLGVESGRGSTEMSSLFGHENLRVYKASVEFVVLGDSLLTAMARNLKNS